LAGPENRFSTSRAEGCFNPCPLFRNDANDGLTSQEVAHGLEQVRNGCATTSGQPRSKADPHVPKEALTNQLSPCKKLLQELLEFFDRKTGVTNDAAHCVFIHWVVSGNRQNATPVTQHDVLTLIDDFETGLSKARTARRWFMPASFGTITLKLRPRAPSHLLKS